MSYTVLARKWRPRGFAQMVGQEHVLRALTNALDADRLHHAFLFAGTRGVGKTTVARILAKCLNCESGVTSKPCGECAACVEIDEGRFVDLIEVDAASRTKVDDTRELLDNVQYTPTRGRYKVYLIDEVHMLSRHSFNALLKTLEEPPPHVKFLLATTDPQRLPVTVLSRCLQFNLKRLSPDLISGQLRTICAAESFDHDEESLTLLARAADGSMRDALSLLDQAVAFGAGGAKIDDVRAMLGTVDRRQVLQILIQLGANDAAGMMRTVAAMDEFSPDYVSVLIDMATLLQRAALVAVVPDALGPDALDAEAIHALAKQLPAEDIQLYYQIALTGQRDLKLAPDPRSGFEMTLLRMLAFRPAGPQDRSTATSAGPASQVRASTASGAPAANAPAPRPAPRASTPSMPSMPAASDRAPSKAAPNKPAPSEPAPVAAGDIPGDWPTLLAQLPVQGAARQLASHCLLGSMKGHRIVLTLDPEHEHLVTPTQRDNLRAAFSKYLGQDAVVTVEITSGADKTPAQLGEAAQKARSDAALQSLHDDPNVQAFKDAFGAVVDNGSVKPLE